MANEMDVSDGRARVAADKGGRARHPSNTDGSQPSSASVRISQSPSYRSAHTFYHSFWGSSNLQDSLLRRDLVTTETPHTPNPLIMIVSLLLLIGSLLNDDGFQLLQIRRKRRLASRHLACAEYVADDVRVFLGIRLPGDV